MTKLTINSRGRLAITNMLQAQQVSIEDSRVLLDLHDKIKFPDEDRDAFFRDIGGGRGILDEKALAAVPDLEIELEKAEAKRLKKLLTEHTQYSLRDCEWRDPILEQLSTVV